MPVPIATSELVGTLLETLGYGIYLVVFPQCVTALRQKYSGISTITRLYFGGTMLVTFLLITVHIVVDLIRTFQAFLGNSDGGGSSEAYFALVDTKLNMVKSSVYVSVTLLADILLIYRTFIICARNWWVLPIPLSLFGVDFAMSVWVTWAVNEARPGNSVVASTVFDRSKYFYIATLALNWYCTVAISLRIWRTQRALNNYAIFRLNNRNSALSIILESAAIYSAALVCLISTSFANSSTMYIFLNSIPPLIGSVFSYVILRSTMDMTRSRTTTTRSTVLRSGVSDIGGYRVDIGRVSDLEPHVRTTDASTYGSGGVHIHLEKVVQKEPASSVKGTDSVSGDR